MAIDSYSLCPGGRGKKIRFCCPDHVKDLEQIDSFISGDQPSAGLSFVEGLLKDRPNCACLLEAKCVFQKLIGLWEDAYETAKGFVELEPKNVVALGELATTSALLDKPNEAVSAMVDAYESLEGDQFPLSLVQATLTVGASLLEGGHYFQAVAVAKQLQAFAPKDEASNAFLYRCLGTDAVPFMLKEIAFDRTAPEGFSKQAEYAAAVGRLARGQWKSGRSGLEALLDRGEEWPNLYRNLAFVEFWFGNEEKGREYLKRFLDSPKVDREDAIDVEQFLLLNASPTWDDVQFVQKFVYELEDFDSAHEKLLSSKSLLVSPQLAPLAGGDVPPKTSFVVLDREPSDKTEGLTLADAARQCGFLFVYGKQTTRAARAIFMLFPNEAPKIESILQSTLGFVPKLESSEELKENPVLWTSNAATPRLHFKNADQLTDATVDSLADEVSEEFADQWFEHRYAVLGDKSPKEVLSEPNGANRVEALIRVASEAVATAGTDEVATSLREKAGIARPEPIDPPTSLKTQEEADRFFRAIPIWRWSRLRLDKCEIETLAQLQDIAGLVAPRDVKEKFAREILSRSKETEQYEDRSSAYAILIDGATMDRDFPRALELIGQATEYANESGKSDAHWNVLEIMTRFQLQEFDKVRALSQRFFMEHADEKEEVQTLQRFFAQLTATAQAQARMAEAYRLRAGASQGGAPRAESVAGLGDAAAPERKSSGLWTPGGDDSESQGGGSKLWVPD
ncbi:MAG: hypothetical protein IJM30_01205 [Thermoguttaceae bacterium]|nr:hypothetical protein [Thermoguttaceae bacterium]